MVSDRKGIAFYLPESRILLDELPDDFYDLSQSEAQMLYHEFIQKRQELDDKPMLTATMRDIEKSRRISQFLERYKYCIVRIQFADRSVLQGIFQPTEPFSEVTNFVKTHLRDDLEQFFLFTTPPKAIPAADKTLLELNFVPGVKLYFSTPQTHISTFLREDILVNINSSEIAAREAHKYRMTKVVNEYDGKDKKRGGGGKSSVASDSTATYCNCPNDGKTPTDSPTDQDEAASTSEAFGGARPKTPNDKIPKWFKSGKK